MMHIYTHILCVGVSVYMFKYVQMYAYIFKYMHFRYHKIFPVVILWNTSTSFTMDSPITLAHQLWMLRRALKDAP